MLEVLNPPQLSSPNPQITISQPSVKSQVVTSSTAKRKTISLDCGNGVNLEMVKVEAGNFNMGSNEYENEQPIHKVQLREFWIGKSPVTKTQYQRVMNTNLFKVYLHSSFPAQSPAVIVSWYDAMTFCQKLAQKTGQKVRLPSESEWEYAARGGNQSKGYKYAGSNNLEDVGWYGNKNPFVIVKEVMQKKANEIGIYDMSGNVWEWCLDEWHDSYKDKPTGLRINGNEPWGETNIINKNDNRCHSVRGGCYGEDSWNCPSTSRYSLDATSAHSNYGFRIVCDVQ